MNSKFFKLLFSLYIKRTARKVWVGEAVNLPGATPGHITADDLERFLAKTWEKYLRLASALPGQPNLRIWLVMNFACLTLAAQRALIAEGIEREVANELITAFTWQVTSGVVRVSDRISRAVMRDQMPRMEYLVNLVMKVVFCKPAYQTEKGVLDGGFFMDVHTCPVAVYMIAHDAADLCISAWCGVDFGLVGIIGGRLERSGTLAMGETRCDFRFFPAG